MHLSILIPIFNQDITKLVADLSNQAEQCGLDFEVLCYDDASTDLKIENEILYRNSRVKYLKLTQNIGRAAIRNKLAEESRGAYLLFLDCDAGIFKNDFIEKYWAEKVENGVVCGGTAYEKYVKNDQLDEFALHRTYGEKREAIGVEQRRQNPYSSFKTFQFLAHRSVLKKVRFDETLRQYGHEDTLFGIELKHLQIPLKHIENQALHEGLEINSVFLQKNKKALENLLLLERRFPILNSEIKVLRVYKILKSIGLPYFMRYFEDYFYKKLLKKTPDLYQFDAWKLAVLSNISLPLPR